jgi:hypothetical protein
MTLNGGAPGQAEEPSHLLITGGQQRPREKEEWNSFQAALVLQIDRAGLGVSESLQYISPEGTRPHEKSAILFKAGTVRGNLLYICTATEVLVLRMPSMETVHYISLPAFHDLHHVTPSSDGNMLVVNTGLDMVMKISHSGEVLQEWSVVGEDTWSRFSRSVDYRLVETTKPHASHPNFVFEIGGEIWVSRLIQNDAICLTSPGGRMHIGHQLHDGIVFRGRVYFTCVNGMVAIFDARTTELIRMIDLNQISRESENGAALGWCRSILPLDDNLCWVGFSRLRPTRFREHVTWVRHGFKKAELPTRIALYDFSRDALVTEVDVEPRNLNSVFSILPVSAAFARTE